MQDSARLLNAVHHAARTLAGSGSIDELLREVLKICVEAVRASGGTIYLHDKGKHALQFRFVLPEEVATQLQFTDIADDHGVAGKVFQTRKIEISEFEQTRDASIEKKTGVAIRTMVTVPLMLADEEPIGVVQLVNKLEGVFDHQDASVLDTVASVSALAIVNSKLLEESTRASQLLGMGKIGHDIKNLAFALEANVSYTDDTLRRLEASIRDKGNNDEELIALVDEIEIMYDDLSSSIDRIKRYSIMMSDLSAGKALQPSKHLATVAQTIQLAAAFLESEGRSRRVRLCYEIQDDAPPFFHDEMYLFRIVQNLVSNAIKATSETMENEHFDDDDSSHWKTVTVRYYFKEQNHIIEVVDDGPGMTPEIAERILSGNARSAWDKSSGSGWGTKIVRELALTHEGDMSIDSEVGMGSTFRIAFPNLA